MPHPRKLFFMIIKSKWYKNTLKTLPNYVVFNILTVTQGALLLLPVLIYMVILLMSHLLYMIYKIRTHQYQILPPF